MTQDNLSAEHHAVARRMADRGYRVIIGYNKGGFWVRNPDMTKPPFVDHRSFISFRKARAFFTAESGSPQPCDSDVPVRQKINVPRRQP